MARRRSLWRHHDFLRLWGAQAVSLMGTQVTALALPAIAILTLRASPLEVGYWLRCPGWRSCCWACRRAYSSIGCPAAA